MICNVKKFYITAEASLSDLVRHERSEHRCPHANSKYFGIRSLDVNLLNSVKRPAC